MAGFFRRLVDRFRKDKVDWDDLEEQLIAGDIGIKTTMEIMDSLQQKGRIDADDVVEVTRQRMLELLPDHNPPLTSTADGPLVVLVAGVNGTGKTTSTAKLAYLLKKQGTDVVLAAADTFRAAAIEQLQEWAGRIDVPLIKGAYKADPSSVCHDAYDAAKASGAGVLLCDTAGRLHTRHNLMEELGKIRRVLSRKHPDAPHERLLVIDATTGSNALQQAREFHKALDLTGLIITKLDGSGKGGIAVAIARELGIPPRFIGTGEKLGDLEPFDRNRYVETLL